MRMGLFIKFCMLQDQLAIMVNSKMVLIRLYRIAGWHWRSYHYAVMHMRNKNSNIQGRSPSVVKVFTIAKGTALKETKSATMNVFRKKLFSF